MFGIVGDGASVWRFAPKVHFYGLSSCFLPADLCWWEAANTYLWDVWDWNRVPLLCQALVSGGSEAFFFLLFYCNLMRVWHKYNKVTCWRQHVEHEEGIEVASHFSVSDTFVLVMVLIIAVPLPLLLCRFVVSFIFWWKIILAAATIINDSIQFWMLFQVVFLRAAAAWSHCSASVYTRFSSYFTASVSDYGTMWSKYFNNVLFSLQAVQ